MNVLSNRTRLILTVPNNPRIEYDGLVDNFKTKLFVKHAKVEEYIDAKKISTLSSKE